MIAAANSNRPDEKYLSNLEKIRSWIEEKGGTPERAFARIMIVNNGLSAMRLIQGIQALSYKISGGKDPELFQIIVLASDADWIGDRPEDAMKRPEYLKQFGICIMRMQGRRPTETYQNQSTVLEIARSTNCDAVAVGWGNLAENEKFANKVEKEGLIFIGPNSQSMRLMGDKIMSKFLLQSLKVPMLDWSGTPSLLDNNDELFRETFGFLDGLKTKEKTIEDIGSDFFNKVYRLTGVHTPEMAKKIADQIGYPIVIKATAGGGGRGIRFVLDRKNIRDAFISAKKEAGLAFGNDVMFIEKAAIGNVRHVEEQVIGDLHGNIVVLGERECSVQRHNQKLVEEAGHDIPINMETRQIIRRSSKAAASGVGYSNAGTVEFLVDENGEPFFMEMNTRLQVEHITTEMLYEGLDLVCEQLKIAMGIQMEARFLNSTVEGLAQGHSISVRILAENPQAGFNPQSGVIENISIPFSGPSIPRLYCSVGKGGFVHPYADSQIGHAVVTGRTRDEARVNMIYFLENLRFDGIITTRPFSVEILKDPEYICGNEINTSWLEEKLESRKIFKEDDTEKEEIGLLSLAIIRYVKIKEERKTEFISTLEAGKRIKPSLLSNSCIVRTRYKDQVYELIVLEMDEDYYHVTMDGITIPVNLWQNEVSGGYLVSWKDQIFTVYQTLEKTLTHVEIAGQTLTFSNELDVNTFRAPMSGIVNEIFVEVGDEVIEGTPLISLEAMKMITTLYSKRSGTIKEILAEPGKNVDAEQSLLIFSGGRGAANPEISGDKDHDIEEKDEIERLSFDENEALLWFKLRRPKENRDLNMFRMRAPDNKLKDLEARLVALFRGYAPRQLVTKIVIRELIWLKRDITPDIWLKSTSTLINNYLAVEKHFRSDRNFIDILMGLKGQMTNESLYLLARSHAILETKNFVLSDILKQLMDVPYSAIKSELQELLEFGYGENYRKVMIISQELLRLLSEKLREPVVLDEMMAEILRTEESGNKERTSKLLERIMQESESLMADLTRYVLTGKSGLKKIAGKLIILRAYRRYPGIQCEYEKAEDGRRTYIWRYDQDKNESKDGSKTVGVVSVVHPDETFRQALFRLINRLDRESDNIGSAFDRKYGVMELLIAKPKNIKGIEELSIHLEEHLNDLIGPIELERVTLVIMDKGESYPGLMTFRYDRTTGRYWEDHLFRNIHPTLGEILSLDHLESFKKYISKLPSSDMNVHLYQYRRKDPRGEDYPDLENKILVRTMIRNSDIVISEDGPSFPAAVDAFKASLHQLRMAYASTESSTNDNQIYLRFINPIELTWENMNSIIIKMQKHLSEFSNVDLTRTLIHGEVMSWYGPEKRMEMVVSVENPTGVMLELKPYMIIDKSLTSGDASTRCMVPFDAKQKVPLLDKALPIREAWEKMANLSERVDVLDVKRKKRRLRGKLYAYDRINLLEKMVKDLWTDHRNGRGESESVESGEGLYTDDYFSVRELELKDSFETLELEVVQREPGNNYLSIIVWEVKMKLPPLGNTLELILVSGDMTLKGGSVAVREDMKYKAAVDKAVQRNIPFVYIAEGSGARIGIDRIVSHRLQYDEDLNQLYLTEEDYKILEPIVKAAKYDQCPYTDTRYLVSSIIGGIPDLRVDWDKGYLYLDEKSYSRYHELVLAEKIMDGTSGRNVWVIKSIKRCIPEINQENLSGSGMTARASAKAFRNVPTMAVVTDTCTGIISYNVRLLKRVIQTRDSEIILTGHRALNALYGGETVFTSNRELGGPHIMGPNGVSHWIVEDELDATSKLLYWLRDLSIGVSGSTETGPLAALQNTIDPVDRDVENDILGSEGIIQLGGSDRARPYDVLELAKIIFDKDSVEEALTQWGATVKVGRARLGGIPIGFIGVGTQTVTKIIPGDPTDPDSGQKEKLQFGQVWYPDSSYKTAEWIEFIKKERKPLVIYPNWRGFAGGMMELFDEILKFGAMIVEKLSTYDLPVVLYLPPYSEIRGGAWVVIDPQINPDHIIFLADEHATGSIIEPSGMETIPLIKREMYKDMRNTDKVLIELYKQRREYTGQRKHIGEIDGQIQNRIDEIYSDYLKKWVQIFRLHNTAERMKEVGIARRVIKTGDARKEIYRAIKEGLEKNSK